jgi:hypothetical protein
MDLEFHYWMTAIIARRAGFDEGEARTIAHSSQLVDDNDVRYSIIDWGTGMVYRNYISQTMDITKPKKELMRIYPLFHFVPGVPDAESARRRDGKMHILNVTPGNRTAAMMLEAAFDDDGPSRLHRIGIATHAFADTWAHQNFVGWHDDFNGMGRILPNIGHADAGHRPDLVGLRWEDPRLVARAVDNGLRFMAAAESLFGRYCDRLAAAGRYEGTARPEWAPVGRELASSMAAGAGEDGAARREEAYRRAVGWLAPYDDMEWFDAAIATAVRGLRDSHDGLVAKLPTVLEDKYSWKEGIEPEKTDWYLFQEAIRAHQAFGMEEIAPIYQQMEVDIWNV